MPLDHEKNKQTNKKKAFYSWGVDVHNENLDSTISMVLVTPNLL